MNTKSSEYWRNKGERDRADNKGYHKPHGIFSDLLTWTIAGIGKMRKENLAYHQGWTYCDNRDNEN